jgi:CO/xanthine dehydrogenase FAD-binding subunit
LQKAKIKKEAKRDEARPSARGGKSQMRAYIPSYQLISPASLGEALDVLATDNGTWRPFAGGTDLMVLLEAGKLSHQNYVNIWNLPELRGIDVTAKEITLGALTTYTDVQSNSILREEFPMLCQAASETGGLAIQNRGTLGGKHRECFAGGRPRLRHCSHMMQNSSWCRSRASEGFHIQVSIRAINRWTYVPESCCARSACPQRNEADALLSKGRHAQSAGNFENLFCGRGRMLSMKKSVMCALPWACRADSDSLRKNGSRAARYIDQRGNSKDGDGHACPQRFRRSAMCAQQRFTG